MKGLHGWMRSLEDSEAAVLSTLLKELDQVTGSDESSGMQLAEVIMKDAGLTANIIRVANSVTFNPSGVSVTTVSRAVINIGFRNIRSICLSIKVLEAVLKDNPSPLLVSMLARSLHGASQSKALCSHLNATQSEEVFVASLLSQLAELLVLGCSDDEVKLLKHEIHAHTCDEDKNRVAERLLGVSFDRLSKTLMKQWRIEGLVHDLLAATEDPDPRVQAIQLGKEISRTSLYGWDSPEFQETLAKVAEFKDSNIIDVQQSVISVADEASETVSSFGRKSISELIPTKNSRPLVTMLGQDEEELLMPDLSLDLSASEELVRLSSEINPNINKIFRVSLKGLHQGVGLERVAIAIFEKDHQQVRVKYAVGQGTDSWPDKFSVRYEKSLSGFLYNLFDRDQIAWIGNSDYKHITQYLGPEFKGVTGQSNFFIAPLMSGRRKIGFMYADMGVSQRELTTVYLEGFYKYCQTVRDALENLGSK